MTKLKVMTVVGTRPEIIRLSRVVVKLDRYCDHTLVHTGQSYDDELSGIFFRDLELRAPDHQLDAAGGNAAETIARVIVAVDAVLDSVRPDAMLVLGDTNSCMAVLPAKRRKIPVFHMEAGNRCFDERVPEEINRRIVDHTADVNLTYSSIAREYLLREGLRPDLVIKTGSPMYEVLSHHRARVDTSDVLDRLGLEERGFFLVSAHREEVVEADRSLDALSGVLNVLGERFGLPVVVSTHPRTRRRMEARGIRLHPGVQLLKPFGFTDYVKLQLTARAVLSDSGTITEESSILNFPALNIRETHERPEGFEEGAVMMVGVNVDRVLQALALLEDQPRETRLLRQVGDYGMPNVSDKVVRIILSYTDYVNRVVWKKQD
jgi:UDP-N-acetylglucosamine 2-epimerase (non-hydrolysing)